MLKEAFREWRFEDVLRIAVRPRPANESQRRESNPQPPHYECGALPIEATLAKPGSGSLEP